jgi:hypothetical protein
MSKVRPRHVFVASSFSIAIIVVAIAAGSQQLLRSEDPSPNKANDFSPYVGKDGSISLPKDYRSTFEHMGTWAVAKKSGEPLFEMHNVYARPEDIEAYRKEGHFADGATLVKEITHVGSDQLTTGQSSWATDDKVWFVMIKDSKKRFPDNALWGDGWGWALFKANEPAKNVATDHKTDCLPCHVPAKHDDWVYIRGYSILRKHDASH